MHCIQNGGGIIKYIINTRQALAGGTTATCLCVVKTERGFSKNWDKWINRIKYATLLLIVVNWFWNLILLDGEYT